MGHGPAGTWVGVRPEIEGGSGLTVQDGADSINPVVSARPLHARQFGRAARRSGGPAALQALTDTAAIAAVLVAMGARPGSLAVVLALTLALNASAGLRVRW